MSEHPPATRTSKKQDAGPRSPRSPPDDAARKHWYPEDFSIGMKGGWGAFHSANPALLQAYTCPPVRLTAWILTALSPAQENVAARAARKGVGISYVTENPLNSYYNECWHYGASQGLRLLKIYIDLQLLRASSLFST